VGLSVMATAALYGAAQIVAIDLDDNRLDFAKQIGATRGVNSRAKDWKEQVFVTHHFALDDIMSAYETFGNAAETGALKVLISR